MVNKYRLIYKYLKGTLMGVMILKSLSKNDFESPRTLQIAPLTFNPKQALGLTDA